MAATNDSAFGALLRHLRTQADLTQEALAERAQLSVRGLSDLERRINTKPRPFTLSRLADALNLEPTERARFERAAAAGAIDVFSENALPRGNFLGVVPEGRLVAREVEMDRIGRRPRFRQDPAAAGVDSRHSHTRVRRADGNLLSN